jgi:hypothetical protein
LGNPVFFARILLDSGPAMPIAASEIRAFEEPSLAEAEQRRHPRYVGIEAGALRLAIRPEFRGRRGLIVDVSASGMGFLLAEPIDAGTALVFELPVPGAATTISRVARVRHSRPHPVPTEAPWLPRTAGLSQFLRRMFGTPAQTPRGEAWLVGCEFDQPLTADEIKQLLDPVV